MMAKVWRRPATPKGQGIDVKDIPNSSGTGKPPRSPLNSPWQKVLTYANAVSGIRINDTLLENARVVQDPPTGPKIDDILPSNLGMPQDSPTGPMNPPNIDIVVGEVDSNPVQGDMPIALEGGLPHNLPMVQEGAEDDDSTSSFGQIPSANFIRDAPSDMEELESDGANTHAESASATRQKEDAHTPTEELESDGSNADVEIANLPKQDKVAHKDNISSSSRQAVSGEIIKDAPSLVAELEGI
ncbi:hypothetical protein J5N97_027803 [Dioscorea zingiberensis]|uniref:Uncharacterized protein n=1 Tax=Dioscorea zingiberensis TaxID=325984 RepID=A0A9D5BY01_9LILI|nr:hypothetical protein J5N97_027803 [Dioscorea zingiberensis]